MTINISDNSPRVSYSVAQGVTQTSFTVSFEFFDNDDLNVYIDGVLKTLTTDYTVTGGDGSTGTITMSVTGASGGSTVVITRDIDLERTTDFPASGAFNIATLNTELDRIIAIAADLDDLASRAITPPDYDPTVSYTLPVVDDRKGKTLAFNATTGAVEAGPSTADVQSVSDTAADIALLADIEDGTLDTNAITNVNAIRTDVTTVSGISGNVTTVANNDANVTTVATNLNGSDTIGTVAGSISNVNTVGTDITNVNTTATNIADVNTVAGEIGVSGVVTIVANAITDVSTVSGDIAAVITAANDLNEAVSEIDTVANAITNVDTVGTNIANVNTVAGISSDITTVAADGTDIGTVATNITNVNTVAGISGNVTTVANISSDVTAVVADQADIGTVATNITNVNTVAGISSNVTTVSGISANVTTVAGISADITAVAGDAADIGAVATNIGGINTIGTVATNISNVNSVGTNITNVNTVAGAETNINTVATNLGGTNTIGTVAGSIANVNSVGGSISDVSTVASNLTDVQSFANTYRIGATDPTTSLDTGDLFFNTTSGTLKVYTGSGWEAGVTAGSGFLPLTGGTLSGNVSFGDNDKAIFGSSGDFEFFHDGGSGYSQIKETGPAGLLIRSNDLRLQSSTGENGLIVAENGAVTAYYDNAAKLATTSTGINVTGTVTADIVQSSSTGSASAPVYSFDGHTTAGFYRPSGLGSSIGVATSGAQRALFSNNGDISFYEDTGTTAKFFWDASAEKLGIGTTSPQSDLEINTTANATARLIAGTSNNSRVQFGDSADVNIGSINYSHASDAMNFTTNNAERMRIDSSGNVGIGTSSPSQELHIASTTPALRLEDTDGGFAQLDASDGNLSIQADQGGATASSFIRFQIDSSERMRIASDGSVGIGTTSPSSTLEVKGANNSDTTLTVTGGTTAGLGSNAKIKLVPDGTAGTGVSNVEGSDGSDVLAIQTNGSERMRIDSSGNLLVGKTSAGTATAGFQTGSDGFTGITRDSDTPLRINRETLDGTIIDLRKDNSPVGGIGTTGGDLFIASSDTGHEGLRFGNGAIVPVDTAGASTDASCNLGGATSRFTDFYLSGGVYLGGTGAANKLDDYEEGTWTPEYQHSTTNASLTYTEQIGYYTKIGDTVHLWFRIIVSTVTTQGTGFLRLGGLPFLVKNSTSNYSSVNVAFSNSWATAPRGGFTQPNSYYATLAYLDANGNLKEALGNLALNDELMGHITYKTS